jgi:hypothetical protein
VSLAKSGRHHLRTMREPEMQMSPPELVFGHACPQHPSSEIAQTTCHRVKSRDFPGWLVTARYVCGHRHTQYTSSLPRRVSDTLKREHPILPEVIV